MHAHLMTVRPSGVSSPGVPPFDQPYSPLLCPDQLSQDSLQFPLCHHTSHRHCPYLCVCLPLPLPLSLPLSSPPHHSLSPDLPLSHTCFLSLVFPLSVISSPLVYLSLSCPEEDTHRPSLSPLSHPPLSPFLSSLSVPLFPHSRMFLCRVCVFRFCECLCICVCIGSLGVGA